MFDRLGRIIADHPWRIVVCWALFTLAATVWAFRTPPAPQEEIGSFLPKDAPYTIANEVLGKSFPNLASRSQLVMIGFRPGGITEPDIHWLVETANLARSVPTAHVLTGVISPDVLRARLVSRDSQAAMVMLNLSTNMISENTFKFISEVEAKTRDPRRPAPAGLTVELTGSAAIGRDYAEATRRALHRTTWVTIAAVLAILILVYRSPVGALVPLVSIGLSVYLTFVVLAAMARYAHWEVSSMEHIFAVVLIFGAGVDYALFWIARYREGLLNAGERFSFSTSAREATQHAGHAVLFSAITTIVGMCSLLSADLGPSHNAGKVLVVSIMMALAAGITLVPAIARLLGPALFWPIGASARPAFAQRVVWPHLANTVVRSPAAVLATGMLILCIPAATAIQMQPRFDSLLQLPEGTTSQRGFQITEDHYSRGQIYGTYLLFAFDRWPGSRDRLREISENLRKQILNVRGVADVYSLDSPVGKNWQPGRAKGLVGQFMSTIAVPVEASTQDAYVSREMPALRFEILIDDPPFSLEAMRVVEQIQGIAQARASRFADADIDATLHFSGLTPYIMGVRDVVGRDQQRVMLLATILIGLIVMFLVRDLPLTAFMVFTTLLNYGATLKLTELFFVHYMGVLGLDWKVRLIVFVIVVAVGQDYNIFLVSRLLEERRRADSREAVRRSVISTGSVISSCGIIMAATLGSLWAGGLALLREVGFALALGILIDTYFIRPILIPSFFLVTRRTGRQPVPGRTKTPVLTDSSQPG